MLNKIKSDILNNRVKILIPIFIFAIFDSAFSSFSSILSKLSEMFPDTSTTLLQLVLSLPTLMLVGTTLFSGLLTSYVHKKTIGQLALLIMCVGGLSAAFIHGSIYILLLSSLTIGLGEGLLRPIGASLISENFNGKDWSTVVGFNQAVNYIGAACLTMLIGYLGRISWYSAYLIYLVLIPIIIMIQFFLPKGQLEDKFIGKKVGLKHIKNVFTLPLIYLYILFFFTAVLIFTFYTNIAMMIAQKGLGSTTLAASVISINSIFAFCIAIIYGVIIKFLKKYTLSFGIIFLSMGLFVLSFSKNLSFVIIGSMMFGLGAALQQICSIYYILEAAPKAPTMAISIAFSLIGLGVSSSPVIINTIEHLVFGAKTAASSLLVAAYGYAIILIVELIRETVFNKNSKIGLVSTDNDKL